jgi:hypothetical protein
MLQWSPFIFAMHEGGPKPQTAGVPNYCTGKGFLSLLRISFPDSGDHFPNILPPPLDLHTSYLTFNLIIYFSRDYRTHSIVIDSYILLDTMTTIHHFISKQILFYALYIQDHRLSLKSMLAKCYLNTLGDKPFISGSAIIFLVLICSRLMV